MERSQFRVIDDRGGSLVTGRWLPVSAAGDGVAVDKMGLRRLVTIDFAGSNRKPETGNWDLKRMTIKLRLI